jgi:predicted ATPase/DNA-binding SARP family transcriptional activator
LTDTLAAALTGRRLLVVLDNCEHVVEGAAALADALLRACPGLALLATSREALGVEGELVWPVAGLTHPPRGDAPAAGAADEAFARALAGYEAVALFVERARAVQPGFALTARTAPAVAAITARLDGLPLALELAAAQVGTLGVEALAVRLDDVFAVLTRGRRTALPRHRTLRALLDWSYHLLAPAERAMLAQLSVFRGTFTLEQAEAVCAPPSTSRDHPGVGALADDMAASNWVVVALGRLAEQSLVDVRDGGPETAGEARYRLLEPVRQYAAARLAGTPEEARTRDGHLRWAAALVSAAGPALGAHGRGAAMRLLRQQLDDLRAAVRWAGAGSGEARAEARARAALVIVADLTHFWVTAGTWEDGWRLFEAAWAAALRAGVATADGPTGAPRLTDACLVGRALVGGATMALLTGRIDAATTLVGSAVATLAAHHANPTHTPAERAEAARVLALGHEAAYEVHLGRGDLLAARAALDLATAAAAESGDERARLLVRSRGARLQALTGDLDGAAATCADAVGRWRMVGDPIHVALTMQLAADLARARGDLRAAAAFALESLTAFGDEFDSWFASRALEQLAAACAAAAAPGSAGAPTLGGPSSALHAAHAAHAAQLLGAAAAVRGRAGVALLRTDQETHLRAHRASETVLGPATFAAAYAEGEQLGSADALGLAERIASALRAAVPDAAAEPGGSPATPARPPVAAGRESHDALHDAPGDAPGDAPRDAPRDRPPSAVEVQLFGPLAVVRGGMVVPASELTPAKVRELLLYLALHPPRTKEQIGLALWPEASPAQLRNAFHVTMHQLRRALGHKDAVTFDGGAYALTRAAGDVGAGADDGTPGAAVAVHCDVDAVLAAVDAVRAADRAAEKDPARGAAVHPDALARWRCALDRACRGALGEGEDAGEWLAASWARVGAAWADGMEALARLHARRGTPRAAAGVLEALVAAEPLREDAHRALMRCYVDAGEPGRALAHYDRLVDLLAREVGAAPGRGTRALADGIRARVLR